MRVGAALLVTIALTGCQVDDDMEACKANLSAIILARPYAERGHFTPNDSIARLQVEFDKTEQGWYVARCMGSRGYDFRHEEKRCEELGLKGSQADASCFAPRGIYRTTKLMITK